MSSDATDRLERLTTLAQEAIRPLSLVVDDVSISPAGRRRVVRIAVDDDLSGLAPGDTTTPVPPLDLDRVADATRLVSDALDDSDVLGSGPYVLEVTSPGVSRPLQEPRHFRRNVGRLVTVTLRDGSSVEGRLVAAGPDGVTVLVPGPKGAPATERTLPYGDIERAAVRVEFSRPGAHDDDHDDDQDDDQED